ncbi:MAG: T9SS type A sorting domain-containing protein, partial [Chitinophagaceae bacterium]
MRRILTLLLLLIAVSSMRLCAQDKYSKVRIPIKNPAAKAFAIDRLELDHYEMKKDAMEVILNQDELQVLRNSGFTYSVLVDDYVAYTIEKNKRIGEHWQEAEATARSNYAVSCKQASGIFTVPTSFGNGGSLRLGAASGTGYFTYAEMITKMNALATAYPGIVTVFNIGTSQNGQTVYGVKLSDNVSSDETTEAEVLYTGLQHAREAIGGTSLIFFAQYLAENYSTDTRIKELVNNREIYIIPCLNPDGYAYNYSGASASYPTTGGGLWRKNRRLISGSTYGVDINRNYSVDWGNCSGASASCGSNTTSAETYYGPSAFSEKETQNVRAFVTAHHFVTAIDQHCFGPYYSLPFGRPSLHTMATNDAYFYTAIPALMGTYNCHRAGNSPETVNYEVAGGIKDWLLMGDLTMGTKGKVYGMTGEAGGGDFWAPISQIKTLCQQNCMQNLQLAYAAGPYFDIQDGSDVALTAKAGSLPFTIRNIGLTVGQATVTIVPIENISVTGSATFTPTNYYDTYSGSINYTLAPLIANGYRVRYAWKVTAGGVSVYDTVTKIYNPLQLLSDNMEGNFSDLWTSSSDATGTSANWAYTNYDKYAGSYSLTESPGTTATPVVKYTTSTTRSLTYRNAFDFSDAANVYLDFWVKHRTENCRDKLQVQVATSSNFNSPTTLCGSHTVAEPSATGGGSLGGQPALTGIRDQWTHVSYDLSAMKGNPAVYLRFVFTSDADADNFANELDDGFYLDNLKVVKTTQTFNVLPVRFVRFTGELQPDGQVRLDWEAYTDEHHDYFEVERSADGIHFISLGRSNPNPPYRMLDPHPESGANHYRVKQVDKDGHVTYSNTVLIHVRLQVRLNIFPNPAHDLLRIELQSTRPGRLQLELRDVQGRSMWQHTGTGSGNLQVPMAGWPRGTYLLQVRDADGVLMSTQRVVKI